MYYIKDDYINKKAATSKKKQIDYKGSGTCRIPVERTRIPIETFLSNKGGFYHLMHKNVYIGKLKSIDNNNNRVRQFIKKVNTTELKFFRCVYFFDILPNKLFIYL